MLRHLGNITKMDPIELKMLKRRTDIATLVVLAVVALLVVRLWQLQIQHGAEYLKRSENNRIRVQQLAAPRGNLLDRHGELMVTNRPRFNVVWIREDAPHPDEVIKRLSRLLELEITELLDRIRAGSQQPHFIPTRLKEDIDWSTLVRIENNSYNLPGVRIEVQPTRDYLYGNMASHLVGYLGEINRPELSELRRQGYRPGDMIGKMGLEKLYEPYLRGEKGRSYVEVDVRGFAQKQLQVEEPLPGNDLQLTLDLELQRLAEEALTDRAGAVVVMEVDSGRLLAMASAPPLPLESFTGGISSRIWRGLLEDRRAPLLNKPIQGQYPPGSVYKIVSALAALEEGVVTPETTHFCNGSIVYRGRRYHCWQRRGHGQVDLEKALAESCDVYFYQVGKELGVDTMANYARLLGLGQPTGVKLEHEKGGLVPTAEWKRQKHGEPWQLGETLSTVIGQGFNLATPLQIARLTAAVANGGRLYRPQLVNAIYDPEGRLLEKFEPELTQHITAIRNSSWETLRRGLEKVVAGERGTGRAARVEDLRVAGKTGTSQVVRLSLLEEFATDEDIPYRYRNHAWFTAFAPVDDPRIAVTVLVEHGGGGGSTAAPVAGTIFEAYSRRLPASTATQATETSPATNGASPPPVPTEEGGP